MKLNVIEWLYLRQKGNLVYYDSLTGTKSRQCYDRLAKKLYHGKEVKVAFIDVNGLKTINDTMGHCAGSEHLRMIAKNLLNISGDKEVYRIGGDEFVVIGNFNHHELDGMAGIASGVVTKEAYEDLSSAVRKADELMYRNKIQCHKQVDTGDE